MKIKKLIVTGIAAIMAVSAMSISAFAADNDVVYSLIGDDGNEIIYTQADIDAGHWNTTALGKESPYIYENFPMNIDKFVNDYGEMSVDLTYMKNISPTTSINLYDLYDEKVVYESKINISNIHIPALDINKIYILTLKEGDKEYKKIIQTAEMPAEMPEYILNNFGENNVLIASTEDLKNIEHISDNGEIIIDNRINPYTIIKSNEFNSYCETLDSNTLYRIYTNDGLTQYAGFIRGGNSKNIFDYSILVSDIDSLYTPSMLSTPTSVNHDNAWEIGFEDYSFKITDKTSNQSKFTSFMINLSDYPLADISKYSQYNFKTTIRGDVALGVYMWLVVDNKEYPLAVTAETGSSTRTITVNLKASKYGITAKSKVKVYGSVYFPTATTGYAVVTPELLQGYEDDVTGSIWTALHDTSTPSAISNFNEFTMTGGLDVDVFYLKTVADCYKVSIRNRSVDEQNDLDNGIIGVGSEPKYLTTYSARYPTNSQATNSTNTISTSEDAVYAIPENVDMSIYCNGSDNVYKKFISVRLQSINSTIKEDKYQLSYIVWGDDSVIEN